MSNESPASILYDAAGNPVGVVLDGGVYRLQAETKVVGALPLAADRAHTDTITALNDTVEIEVSGCGVVAGHVTGSWVGTLVAEATIDGTNWFPIVCYLTGDAQTAIGETTANGTFRNVCVGFYKTRLRASAWTSGTATIACRASAASTVTRANIGQTAYTSPGNSTTTPFGTSGVFTGAPEICISTMGIQINVFSDKDSAYEGLRVEQSMDGTNWDIVDHFTVLAGEGFSRTIQSTATYCRVKLHERRRCADRVPSATCSRAHGRGAA